MTASLDYQQISLPNLSVYPYITQQVSLNGILYFLEYTWNIRHQKAYLSIFTKVDNIEFYLVRNVSLITGIEISKYIIDDDWSGTLTFAVNDECEEFDYRIDNFHTDFHLNYFSE